MHYRIVFDRKAVKKKKKEFGNNCRTTFIIVPLLRSKFENKIDTIQLFILKLIEPNIICYEIIYKL